MTLTPVVTNNPYPVLYEDCGDNPDIPEVVQLVSDAMMSPSIIYMDSFSAGRAQSLGHPLGAGNTRQFGRYDDLSAGFDYFTSGGRDGGGYIKALADARLWLGIASSDNAGNDRYHTGEEEEPPTQGGVITIHNLFGKTIAAATTLQDIGGQVKIQVMPDLTLRAFTSVAIGTPTTHSVPATGWFAIETHIGIAPTLLTSGGFVNTNLYVIDGEAVGIPIIRLAGYNVRTFGGDTIERYFVHVPQDTGLCALALLGPYGESKRWMYDLIFDIAWPSAPGDSTESIRSYEHYEDWGFDLDGNTVSFGPPGGMTWGDEARWKNVLSKDHVAYLGEENLYSETAAGELSVFTFRWLTPGSPFYPESSLDPIIRNTFVNEATDFYKVAINKTDVAEIEAIGTFSLGGARSWRERAGGFLFPFNWWNLTGPHPYVGEPTPGDFGWPRAYVQDLTWGSCNAAYEQLIKTPSGTVIVNRKCIAMANNEWRTELGYVLNLVKDKDPSTNERWDKDNLPQVGVRGTFEFLDALDSPVVDPDDRWVQVDIGQLGFDVAYRSRILEISPPEIQPPIADYHTVSFIAATGVLNIYDKSVDFNGNTTTLTSNIVSRIMDWGDGSPLESIPVGVVGGVATGTVSHTYDASGATYIAKLTVTNVDGLTDFITKNFVTVLSPAIAGFSAGVDGDDPTELTLNFTDSSSVVGGTIVSRLWNFGDGNTSTATNPSHTYADYGSYTVTLTVTANHGQVDTESQDFELVEPVVVPSDCGFSAITLANTAFAMGDDYNGGNPPLPAYANTAAFDTYYTGAANRDMYDDGFSSAGVDHSIDSSVLYDGHNTFKMVFGAGKHGAGWDTTLSNDASPVEGGHYRTSSHWLRFIFKADAGVMSDGSIIASDFASGLEIVNIAHTYISLRAGNLYLDVDHKETGPGDPGTEDSHLICNENVFVGRVSGFGELIIRYDADPVGHTVRTRVWAGDACSLGGVSPLVDSTHNEFRTAFQMSTDFFDCFNWFFTPSGAAKGLWLGLVEFTRVADSANPHGVALT